MELNQRNKNDEHLVSKYWSLGCFKSDLFSPNTDNLLLFWKSNRSLFIMIYVQ